MYKILILLVWKNLDEGGALSPPHTVKMYVPYLHSKKRFQRYLHCEIGHMFMVCTHFKF